jgi:glycosyltransferase involved in cell wall biosynthesis
MSRSSGSELHIFLVTYNKAEQVREVIRRIYAYTRAPFRLTIVDNASDQDTLKLLQALYRDKDNVTLIRNNRNRWCGGGSNQALALTEEPFAAYLCSYECFIVEDGWDQRCLDFMQQRPRVALAGHLISSPKYATGRGYKELERFALFRHREYVETRLDDVFFHVQGGFFVVRMEAARQIGFFNAAIAHDYMDVEFSYAFEASGWQVADLPFVNSMHSTTLPNIEGYMPQHIVYHPLSVERLAQIEQEKSEAAKRGRACNICGWKGPTFRDTVAPRCTRDDSICPQCGARACHRALLGYLDSTLSLHGKHVLDIAPVSVFQQYFEQRGADYISMAPDVHAMVRGDLRAAPWADGSFDVVICYHVLEHIKEDHLAIGEIVRVLKPQGVALVQVPQNQFRWRTIEFSQPDEANHGHVRDPGLDYVERLCLPGVDCQQLDCGRAFDLPERIQYGIYKDTGITYQLTKP